MWVVFSAVVLLLSSGVNETISSLDKMGIRSCAFMVGLLALLYAFCVLAEPVPTNHDSVKEAGEVTKELPFSKQEDSVLSNGLFND